MCSCSWRILDHIINVFVFWRILDHIIYVFMFSRILDHIIYVFVISRIPQGCIPGYIPFLCVPCSGKAEYSQEHRTMSHKHRFHQRTRSLHRGFRHQWSSLSSWTCNSNIRQTWRRKAAMMLQQKRRLSSARDSNWGNIVRLSHSLRGVNQMW